MLRALLKSVSGFEGPLENRLELPDEPYCRGALRWGCFRRAHAVPAVPPIIIIRIRTAAQRSARGCLAAGLVAAPHGSREKERGRAAEHLARRRLRRRRRCRRRCYSAAAAAAAAAVAAAARGRPQSCGASPRHACPCQLATATGDGRQLHHTASDTTRSWNTGRSFCYARTTARSPRMLDRGLTL
jgi:hypothetical protein